MAKVFLSFLGTNPYLEAIYTSEEFTSSVHRHAPAAVLEMLQHRGERPDRLVIFLTDQARVTNWDGSYGLAATLAGMGWQSEEINDLAIPMGKDEDELWTLFDPIIESVSSDDRLFIDVTHGFRSLPVIFTVAIDYLQKVRHAELGGVYYGAFEVLGTRGKVEKMPVGERRAPIFDLTPFFVLQQWTTGIEHLLTTGDGRGVAELTARLHRKYKKIHREKMGETIAEFGKTLRRLSEALICAAAPVIPHRATELLEVLDRTREEAKRYLDTKPLVPVIETLRDAFDQLACKNKAFPAGEYLRRQLAAAGLLLDYHRYMQAFTLLREAMVDTLHLAEKGSEETCRPSRHDRDFLSALLGRFHDSTPPEREVELGRHEALKAHIEGRGLLTRFVKLHHEIAQLRNRLDHAWTDPSQPFSDGRVKLLAEKGKTCIGEFCGLLDEITSASVIRADPDSPPSFSPRMLVLLNHECNAEQEREARERFGVTELLSPPEEVGSAFGEMTPEGELGSDQITPFVDWLEEAGRPGDYLWIQGEHGLTVALVQRASRMGLIPVYATTRREAHEERQADGSTVAVRRFSHVQFRRYVLA